MRRLAGMEESPIRDIPSRKPRNERAQTSPLSKFAPPSDFDSKSSRNSLASSGLVTSAPFESLTPGEIAANMSDTSGKGKGRPEEIQSEDSGQAKEDKYQMSLE